MIFLTKFVKICYNTYRKCGRPLPGGRRPGPPVGGRPLPAHLPRSRAFQARGSWKLEAGTLWRAGSWHLNEGAAGSWELRRRSWKISRAASWGTAGRTVQLGARSWAAEGKAQLGLREKRRSRRFTNTAAGSCARRAGASWAEPKVQLELIAQSEAQAKRGKSQLRVWLIFRTF